MSIEQPVISKEERNHAMLCHLAALSTMVGVPFGWILGPLTVWLVKKNDYPFVDDQGKESVNFQISMTVYLFILALLGVAAFVFIANVGHPMMIVISYAISFIVGGVWALFWLISVISGAVAASGGKQFRYPLTIRFIK